MSKHNLEEVMLQYVETRDSDLITEDVYKQLIKLAYSVCGRFTINHPIYRIEDEMMSAINVHLWRFIQNYDISKGNSIISYIGMLMYSAILYDIRINSKNKKYGITMYSMDDKFKCETNEEMELENILEDKSSLFYIDVMIINESARPIINRVLDRFISSAHNDHSLRNNIREILQMKSMGITQKEIAKIYGVSRPTVSRIVNEAKELIMRALKAGGII